MTRTPARLAAREVSFAYDAQLAAVVDGWSAAFNPGEMVALTGPSGCGKSTRLFLLALMLTLRSGQVELDGVPVDRLGDGARASLRAKRFGFVFQDSCLDSTRTVRDNALEACLYRGQSARALDSAAQRLLISLGVDVPMNRRPGQLSGGQAQRIALCRALVGDPDIIFADEPTGNLDPESSDVVVSTLRRRARAGATVIVVTHDPLVAARCDRDLRLVTS